jgi:nucleotide-binding universal stress UspA family protein
VTLVPDRTRFPARAASRPLALLVAVDGSTAGNRVVQHAARQCAGNPDVRVVLLNVQPGSGAGNLRRPSARGKIDSTAQEQAAAVMRQAERILGKAGIAYERRVARGDVVDTILAAAAESGCARIVLGSRGRGAAKSLLLGSVVYGVVHHAEAAVTVVRQALPAPVLLPGPAGQR